MVPPQSRSGQNTLRCLDHRHQTSLVQPRFIEPVGNSEKIGRALDLRNQHRVRLALRNASRSACPRAKDSALMRMTCSRPPWHPAANGRSAPPGRRPSSPAQRHPRDRRLLRRTPESQALPEPWRWRRAGRAWSGERERQSCPQSLARNGQARKEQYLRRLPLCGRICPPNVVQAERKIPNDHAQDVVFTVIGLAVALLATLFTASLVVAFAGIATVLLAGRALTMRMQPKAQPAYVYADRRNTNRAQPVRSGMTAAARSSTCKERSGPETARKIHLHFGRRLF